MPYMNDDDLAKRMDELGRHDIAGCLRCGCWDRDEEGRLMCVCPPERYKRYHPEPAESSNKSQQ